MKRFPFLSTAAFLLAAFLADARAEPLAVGDTVPEVILRDADGTEHGLRRAIAAKPAVVVFYRGAWCPYCTKHLSGLAEIHDDLRAAGYQVIAISIDRPSKLREKSDYQSFDYTLLSDADAAAAKAFGIAFRVPDDLVAKYKNDYSIDLEAASGQTHHLLPHPAVYVVDTKGTIRFAHVNENYRKRLAPKKVLAAAREAAAKG